MLSFGQLFYWNSSLLKLMVTNFSSMSSCSCFRIKGGYKVPYRVLIFLAQGFTVVLETV